MSGILIGAPPSPSRSFKLQDRAKIAAAKRGDGAGGDAGNEYSTIDRHNFQHLDSHGFPLRGELFLNSLPSVTMMELPLLLLRSCSDLLMSYVSQAQDTRLPGQHGPAS